VTTPAIRVHDVSKRFRINANKSLKEHLVDFRRTRAHTQEFWALREVGFDVPPGATLGLIGHNGSGKSTLLKTVGGILQPDTGYVERRGRLAALLELGAGFHGDLTGRENIFLNAAILGLPRKQVERYFDAIVDFSGIEEFLDTQVKFYSSGMYVRLAFSVAIHVEPEILLIDEVLAVGDEAFQRKCLKRIKTFQREGRTIILVTHGLDLARELCDRVVLLDHGRMAFDGDPVAAVRTIREMFEQQDADHFYDREVPDAESGSGTMTISDVRILDEAGEPMPVTRPGQPMVVEFAVTASQRTSGWIAGIAIENQFDQLCFGSNSKLLQLELEPVEGRRTVRFRFPALGLSEGNYHITLAVHPETGPEYHRLSRVGRFRVIDTHAQDGPVHLVPAVEVLHPSPVPLPLKPGALS
jgi:ABC-2 type transport system ATP-binding protein